MLSKLFQWIRCSHRTHVVHLQDGDCHAVLLDALRVLVCEEEPGLWSAQGVEIDFAASGTSVEDVQTRFEYGLGNTLRNHIEKFGGIDKLLRFAPQNVWGDLVGNAKHYNLNIIRVHEILARNPAIVDIESLYQYSESCRIPTHMPFGKYKGWLIAGVPRDYVSWYLRQDDTDPYLIKAFRR